VAVRLHIQIEEGFNPIAVGDAVAVAAEVLRQEWVSFARKYADTGRYAESIKVLDIEHGPDGFKAILEAQSPYSLPLEDGRVSFNMAERINWGASSGVRVTKEGKQYMIIPFRHAAYVSDEQQGKQGISATALRNMMPESIHNLAQKLERSYFHGGNRTYVTYQGPASDLKRNRTQNIEGKWQEERDYRWAKPLTGPEVSGTKLNRMYKFGKPRHTSYMTFRTITPGSNWIIPAFPGHHMAEQAADAAADRIADIIADAVGVKSINVITGREL
jgi:hypothetical protein